MKWPPISRPGAARKRSGRSDFAYLSWYFQPRWPERYGNGRLYELLGIRLWKRFLRTSGDPTSSWHAAAPGGGRRAQLIGRLRRHDAFTRRFELRHLAGALVMQGAGMTVIASLSAGNVIALTVANSLVNGYPILLQRYNRVRVQTALRRLGASEAQEDSKGDEVLGEE